MPFDELNGLALADIKTIEGLAIASVKTYNGVAPAGPSGAANVYAAAGRDSGFSAVDTHYRYNIAGDSWSTMTALTAARYSASEGDSPVIGTDNWYYIGGRDSGGTGQSTNYEYSVAGNNWTTETAMTTAKGFYGGSTIGTDKFYAICGLEGSFLTTNYEYSQSGDSWATKTAFSTATYRLALSTIGTDKAYLVGGDTGAGVPNNPSLTNEYSQSGNSWASKANTPTPIAYQGQATIGTDKTYAIGGVNSGGSPQNVNIEYSQSGNSWATKTVAPATLMGTDCSGISTDELEITGGYSGVVRTSNYQYSQSGDSYATLAVMTAAKLDHSGGAI